MPDFEADVTAFVARAKAKMVRAYLALGDAAVNRVKELTPVNTGNLRANWQLAVVEAGSPLPTQGSAAGEAKVGLTMRLGQMIAVINPVEYARPVEYGYSRQLKDGSTLRVEGRGMLTQTYTELPQIAERVLAELRRTR